jgi:actin-like ATPase involved in cell morphogenesis
VPVEVLGIDFGTSNTVAVLAGGGRPPRVLAIDGTAWMPSSIYVDDDDTLSVGRDAERKARLAPERFESNPKRRIDDGEILLGVRVVPVVDAIAAVLRRVGEEARRQLNGRNPDEVHLTHPAQWGSSRQNILLAAARAAGLGTNITLLPEPVAAAAHFASLPGNSFPPGSALAVYDLGGGTFDAAVVGATPHGFTVLAEGGLPDVGGVDFDQTIVDHLGRTAAAADPGRWQTLLRPRTAGDRRAARALREDVRAAKETLSRYSQTDLPLPEPYEDTLLTRREFEGLIRPAITRTVEMLAATVERAGIAPNKLAGVYLVGGSSRIPLIATVISEKLGVVASTLDQPETSVAMGAALAPGGMRPPGRTENLAPPGGRPMGPPLGPPSGPPLGPPSGPPLGPPSGPVLGPASGPQMPRPGVPAPMPGQQAPRPGAGAPAGPPQAPPGQLGPATTQSAPVPVAIPASGPVPGAGRSGGGGSPPPPAPSGSTRSGPAPAGPARSGPVPAGPPAGVVSNAGRAGRKRLFLLGGVAAAVIAAVVVIVIVATSGSSGGAGPSTTTTPPPATSATSASSASAAVPSVPATCQTSPVDNDGMTPCMSSLAGPVKRSLSLTCAAVPATDTGVQNLLHSIEPVSISACTGLRSGALNVIYIQLDTADHAAQVFNGIVSDFGASAQKWSQGGANGQYLTSSDSTGQPELISSYAQVPVIMAVTVVDGKTITAADLKAFWQGTLLPPG